MTKAGEHDWLRKRLDAIIQLLMERGDGAAKSVTDKIGRLLDMGFTQAETAQMVGKPANYVAAIAGRRKKAGSTKKGKAKAKVQPSAADSTSALTTEDTL